MYHVLEISWPELLFPLWSFSYKHVIILIVLKDSLVARNLCSGQQRIAPSVIMNMARWTTVCGRVLLVVRSCPFHLKNLTAHCSLGLVGRLEQTLHMISRSWKSLKMSAIRFSMLVGGNGPGQVMWLSGGSATLRWVISLALPRRTSPVHSTSMYHVLAITVDFNLQYNPSLDWYDISADPAVSPVELCVWIRLEID